MEQSTDFGAECRLWNRVPTLRSRMWTSEHIVNSEQSEISYQSLTLDERADFEEQSADLGA